MKNKKLIAIGLAAAALCASGWQLAAAQATSRAQQRSQDMARGDRPRPGEVLLRTGMEHRGLAMRVSAVRSSLGLTAAYVVEVWSEDPASPELFQAEAGLSRLVVNGTSIPFEARAANRARPLGSLVAVVPPHLSYWPQMPWLGNDFVVELEDAAGAQLGFTALGVRG